MEEAEEWKGLTMPSLEKFEALAQAIAAEIYSAHTPLEWAFLLPRFKERCRAAARAAVAVMEHSQL